MAGVAGRGEAFLERSRVAAGLHPAGQLVGRDKWCVFRWAVARCPRVENPRLHMRASG